MESSSYRINSHDNSESDSDDNFLQKNSRNVFSQTGIKRCSESLINNIPLNSDQNLSNDDDLSSTQNHEIPTKRKKINNIWSSVLQEQTLSTVFDICNMERQPHFYDDRHCESYDYRRRELDTRPDIDPDLATVENEETFPIAETIEEETSLSDEKVTSATSHKQHLLSPKEYKIAKLIVRKLQEKKYKLVFKVVKVLGTRKALELLKKTQHIEKNGGMMVLNKSRRRTPGGVFFHLIKSDHRIPKEQFDEIFGEEEENFNLRRNTYKDFENHNKVSKFHVLRCYSCKMYQVHQMKKSNQWNCKVCYEKQSVKQVYFQGTAVECREHTQKLNLLNKTMDCAKENEMELVTEIKNETSNNPQIPSTSKWSEFLPKNEQEKMDDDNDLTSIQENHYTRKEDTVFQDKQESVCNKNEEFSIDGDDDGEIKSVLNSDNSFTSKWNEFI